jgi:hypothetical protein
MPAPISNSYAPMRTLPDMLIIIVAIGRVAVGVTAKAATISPIAC